MVAFGRMPDTTRSRLGLCYVLLILDNVTELFVALWSTWDVRNTYILMVDEKSCLACKSLCRLFDECFENVTCVDGHNGSWGGFSLVSATLSGIKFALEGSLNWQHLFLISGNHVALQDQDRIHSCLTIGKSYLRSDWLPRVPRPSESEFAALPYHQQRLWGRWEESRGVGMMRTGIRGGLPGIHFYSGSQWMALSRAACEALSGRQASMLARFFRHVFVADETFFHTTVRVIESRNNIHWMSTTYHGWHGGRATELTEDEYRKAAHSGWWFGRKVPKSLTRSYLDTIRRQCRTFGLDVFADLVNARSVNGSMVEFKEDVLSVTTAADSAGSNGVVHSKYDKLLRTLHQVAGTAALVGNWSGDLLDIRIEPPTMAPGKSPVVGVVRATDTDAAWLTIQLRAALFSESLATLFAASDRLSPVIDDTFEETPLEPQFREFLRREFRTAYVFDMATIDSSEAVTRLTAFVELLAEAWRCVEVRRGGRISEYSATLDLERLA